MDKKELINMILDMSDDQLSDVSNYILKAQEGVKMMAKPTYEQFVRMLPEDEIKDEKYNLKRAFELAPWEELYKHVTDPEKYHLRDFYWNENGEGEFMKRKDYDNLYVWDKGDSKNPGGEIGWYKESPDAEQFRKEYYLDESGEYPKYIKRTEKKEQGGILSFNNQDVQYSEVNMEDFFNEENNN